ncbi:MAG: hypothetical protein ACLQU2_01710 [Candidatus Binataceae bacterium]
MADAQLELLTQRFEQLERRLKWWKGAVVALGLATTGLAVLFTTHRSMTASIFSSPTAQKLPLGFVPYEPEPAGTSSKAEVPDEVVAKKFVVKDRNGKTVATLGSWRDGSLGLIFTVPGSKTTSGTSGGSVFDQLAEIRRERLSARGTSQAEQALTNNDSSGGLAFSPNGESSLLLRAGSSASISLDSQQGPAELFVVHGNDPSKYSPSSEKANAVTRGAEIWLWSDYMANGTALMAAPREESITFSDQSDPRVVLGIGRDGTPNLALFGRSEDAYLGPGELTLLDQNGGGAHLDSSRIRLFDRNGTLRNVLGSVGLETTATGATEETSLSSLTLFDNKGKVIWRAP